MKRFYVFMMLCLVAFGLNAQTAVVPPAKQLIQFSGVIVAGDSLEAIPFTSVMIKGTSRGTVSDYYGFFSIVAQVGDVVEFSAVGFRKGAFHIPDSLKENKYSLIHMLHRDTVQLKETVIFPWPTKEQFKEAFLTLNIPDDDLERARKNLEREEMRERFEGVKMDGSMNQKFAQQQYNNRLYYAGQYPPNNLLNPIAWSKFIKAWKRGDFKRQ